LALPADGTLWYGSGPEMKFQLLLHEGVIEPNLQPRLAQELRRIYTRNWGGAEDHISVNVTEIPKGRFFTAAKPSRSSLVGGSVPAGTSRTARTRLMAEITSMWCELTGCTPNEIVVSISDAPT
jgi:phenylpyruvate tautomerase PptA (4-oxalocrotonate tautomerase family)